jgi:amino acid adenylation domain-containing protein
MQPNHSAHEHVVPSATGETIYQRFARQAELTPEAVAVNSGSRCLTYAGLRAQADRMARLLVAGGIGEDAVVGICLDRCIELVATALGVLQIGAAYLPLDPRYPRDRLDFMITAASAQMLVTHSNLSGPLWDTGASTVPTLEVDRIGLSGIGLPPDPPDWLPARGTPDSRLYVVFTSGSTGRPKAVAVANRSLLNLFDWYVSDTGMGPGDVQVPTYSFSFDAGTLELMFPLSCGARLVLGPEREQSDSAALLDLIAAEQATVMNLVPSRLRRLLEEPCAAARLSSLQLVVCGGEVLGSELRDRFLRTLPGTRLVNHYGPSEATIFATSWTCALDDTGPVPIGRPVVGVHTYVLGDRLEPSRLGVPGELYLGGVGVAQGYLGAAVRTAEAFLPDPFSSVPGARMYRTGDQARFRPDGALDFLGRADEQVQLRGYRIELGEIEAVLLRHAAVRGAAAVLRTAQTGEPLLAAYAEHDGSVTRRELRAHLADSLPRHMLPGHLELLDRLPRTVTGKVDKALLPAPPGRRASVRPRDERELIIAEIVAATLGLPEVGICDDFFVLGGDSLQATRALMRINRSFGVEVPLIAILENATVAALGAAVAAEQARRSFPAEHSVAAQQCAVKAGIGSTRSLADGNPLGEGA